MKLAKNAEGRPSTVTRTPEQEDQIRLRAYEIYEQRGRQDGHDIDDWLQAETEILTAPQRAAAA
jgi:hypothetical protein